MAIFSNDNRKFNGAEYGNGGAKGVTIISKGTKFVGDVFSDCRLHIDGEAQGNINSTDVVIIGKNGKHIGNIKTNSLIVSGIVEGDVEADSLEIKSQGLIKGTICTNDTVIERKGALIGTSKPKSELKSTLGITEIEDKPN